MIDSDALALVVHVLLSLVYWSASLWVVWHKPSSGRFKLWFVVGCAVFWVAFLMVPFAYLIGAAIMLAFAFRKQ